MGKNKTLKTVGDQIGNVVLHKMLAKYTNKPESIGHLINEENEYHASALKDSKKFNWNTKDIEEMGRIAFTFFKNKSARKYPDVSFPLEEMQASINEEINRLEISAKI